ncbi:MAG: PAS domain S-box protein [Ignavibacteriales bacterium]|nr:MAG: PAS domain S-box protein [Ignavibacteriales bacterium]
MPIFRQHHPIKGVIGLRTKLNALSIFLIALISAFISVFFTLKFEDQIKRAVQNKSDSISRITAWSFGQALYFKDENGLDDVIESTKLVNEIEYIVLVNDSGNVVRASNIEVAEQQLYITTKAATEINYQDSLYKILVPIPFRDQNIGKLYIGYSLRDYHEEIFKARITTTIIGFIVFLAGVLIVIFISNRITKPFMNVLDTTQLITEGDLKARINIKTKDEVSSLADYINSLAEKLEKAYHRIEKVNIEEQAKSRGRIRELALEINQRKITEVALRKSEERFRLMFELAPVGMVILSPKNLILDVNKAFCNTVGYEHEELINKSYESISHADDWGLESSRYNQMINQPISDANFEKRFIRKDTKIINAIVEAVVIKDDKGNPLNFIIQAIDITLLKKAQKELIAAKERAEESDRLKTAFLAQMSHEIRTPLNVILTSTSIIEEELSNSSSDGDDSLMLSVNSAGKRLLRTIDLILNMSSIQSGSYKAEYEPVELNKELFRLTTEFKSISGEKNIDLMFSSQVKDASVLADKYTVTQIFQNLIDNALKYTHKGKVEVSIHRNSEKKICVEIKDTGIGISKEYQKNLFQTFSQEDQGHIRKFEGNGLGLALVKKYVELNNAEISFTSEKGVGSTFIVIFDPGY